MIHFDSDGHTNHLARLFIDKESNVVKEVIQKIKFPTIFFSNVNNILINKGEFGGGKNHDWHTFINIIILVYFYSGIHYFSNFLFTLEKVLIPSSLQYVLSLSLLEHFDDNIKQVICDLGKYMR